MIKQKRSGVEKWKMSHLMDKKIGIELKIGREIYVEQGVREVKSIHSLSSSNNHVIQAKNLSLHCFPR